MVGTDHLPSVPPVKDRVGSTETDGAMTVIPAKESLFKGKGEYFLLDRPPLIDGPQTGHWDVLRSEGTSTFSAGVDVRQIAGIRRRRHPGHLTWLKTPCLIGDRLLQLYLL